MSKSPFQYRSICSFTICLSLLACTNRPATESLLNLVSLEKVKEIRLPLAHSTSGISQSANVFIHEEKEYLGYFHYQNNVISVFDLQQETLVDTISFATEGPNEISLRVIYSKMINYDSIFLFDPLPQMLYLVDRKGNILNSFEMLLNNDHYLYLDGAHSMQINGLKLYVPIYPSPLRSAESTDFGCAVFDMQTQNYSTFFELDEAYSDGFWGQHNYRRSFVEYNDIQDLFIFSYPISNKWKQFTPVESSVSQLSGPEVLSLRSPFSDYISADQSIFDYEIENGRYGHILHDKWRDVYYQFVYLPTDLEDYFYDGLSDAVVVVFNSNLKQIGQLQLRNNPYAFGLSFFSQKGLCLLDKDYFQNENEDILKYDVYRIENL